MRVIISLFTIYLFFTVSLVAQETTSEPQVIDIGASYTGDFGRNLTGGIIQDNLYLGLIELSLDVNLEQAGLWQGSSMYATFINTHGRDASTEVIGDAQVASNINNGDANVIMNALFMQQWDKLNLFIGKHDLNADFMACEHAGLFLNSSTGVAPNVSGNLPVSIFPFTAVGVGAFYNPVDALTLKIAVYDGIISGSDKYSADFVPSFDEYLTIIETEYRKDSIGGALKAGIVYKTGEQISINNQDTTNGNAALYLMIDKNLIQMNTADLVLFGHFGISPEKYNDVGAYYSGGLTIENINKKHSCGIVYGHMQKGQDWRELNNTTTKYESFIEATVALQINEQIKIQPDVQYIINPGVSTELQNALVGFIRIGLDF